MPLKLQDWNGGNEGKLEIQKAYAEMACCVPVKKPVLGLALLNIEMSCLEADRQGL